MKALQSELYFFLVALKEIMIPQCNGCRKKLHHLCSQKLVPYKPYYAIRSAPWLDFSQKNGKRS